MSLHLLLDENMSQVVAEQVRHHRPGLVIESVHTWKNGIFEGRADKTLLRAAAAEELTLVTYDQKTIPAFLAQMYAAGEDHAGVVFVDSLTVPSSDFGTLTRAVILLWERFSNEDWQNRVSFLEKPAP